MGSFNACCSYCATLSCYATTMKPQSEPSWSSPVGLLSPNFPCASAVDCRLNSAVLRPASLTLLRHTASCACLLGPLCPLPPPPVPGCAASAAAGGTCSLAGDNEDGVAPDALVAATLRVGKLLSWAAAACLIQIKDVLPQQI